MLDVANPVEQVIMVEVLQAAEDLRVKRQEGMLASLKVVINNAIVGAIRR